MSSDEDSVLRLQLPVYNVVTRCVLGSVITCENVLLLVVIVKYKLTANKYFFTVSLAVTDLLVGLILIALSPLFCPSLMSSMRSESLIGVAVFYTIVTGMLVMSAIQMAIIALERYLYIGHPFLYQKRLTPRVIRWTVLSMWILGFLFMLAFGFVYACMVQDHRHNNIISKGTAASIFPYLIGFTTILYLCVIPITCVCYVLIIVEVRRHSRTVARLGAERNIVSTRKEGAKSLRFFLAVFGVYLVMTFPASTVSALSNFNQQENIVNDIFTLLLFANSGMNFLIVTLIDNHFRGKLKDLLKVTIRMS